MLSLSAIACDCATTGACSAVVAKLSSRMSYVFDLISCTVSSLGLLPARRLDTGLQVELCDTRSRSGMFATGRFDIFLCLFVSA